MIPAPGSGDEVGFGAEAGSTYYYLFTDVTADDGAGVDEDGDYVLTAENTHVTGITVGIYASDGTQVAAGTYGGTGTITLTEYSAEDTAELSAESGEKTLGYSDFSSGNTTATAKWEITTDGGSTYTAAEDVGDFVVVKHFCNTSDCFFLTPDASLDSPSPDGFPASAMG